MKSLGFLGLVFDTGLSVTPLMSHLGCLASHWSVPVFKTHSNQVKGVLTHTLTISPIKYFPVDHAAPAVTSQLCAVVLDQ